MSSDEAPHDSGNGELQGDRQNVPGALGPHSDTPDETTRSGSLPSSQDPTLTCAGNQSNAAATTGAPADPMVGSHFQPAEPSKGKDEDMSPEEDISSNVIHNENSSNSFNKEDVPEQQVQQYCRDSGEAELEGSNDVNRPEGHSNHDDENTAMLEQKGYIGGGSSANPTHTASPATDDNSNQNNNPVTNNGSHQQDLNDDTIKNSGDNDSDKINSNHEEHDENCEAEDGNNQGDDISSKDSDSEAEDPSVEAEILENLDESEVDINTSAKILRRMLRRKTEELRSVRISALRRENQLQADHEAEKATLEARVDNLLNKLNGIREPSIPWRKLADAYMHGRLSSNGKPVSWNCVVRTSCRQGNMSMNPKTVHPDLQWAGRKYTDRQLRRPRDDLQRDEVLLLSQDKQSDAAEGGEIVTIPPFPFDKLPLNVQHRVFQYLLVKPGLIHCLSRLSQKNEPREDGVFPFASSGKCGFPHRFVIGNQGVSNTWTWKGSDVLYPLLVSQRWLYVGLHTFYGMNTFAFSSLGELGRFFNGIGQSRAERVAHIELMWHGSIMPRVKSRINQRTLPLNWLTRMRQLATFTVFMEEGAERRVRRKHEFPKIPEEDKFEEDWKFYDFSDRYQDYTRMSIEKINSRGPNPHWDPLNPPSTKSKGFNPRQSLMKRTAGQPNCRANRSLRTCHGMDFVYQLRGMRWVRFYEVGQNRRLVRDWSFTDDINSVATMPKSPRYAVECELANLTTPHGLNRFVPEGQDKDMVHSFYNPCAILSVCGGSDTSISENLSGADSAGSSSDTNGVPDAGSDDSSPNDGDFGDGDSGVDMMGVDEDGDPIFNLRYPDEWTDSDDYDNQYVNMEDNDATNCIIYPDESDFESGDDYDDVDLDDTLACEDGDSGVGDIYSDVETSFIDKDDTAAKYETQPTTQEEGTESHCSVFVAGAGPENDDDDDDESLFVAEDRDNTTVSPTESSHRSLSPYPSAVASMGPPPRPQAGTTVRKTITIDEAAEIIDLTGDDDDKSTGDCNATTSDRSDYADGEVIFGRAPSVASTVVKEEQWSSDEFRRRVLMIDLTGSFDQPAPQGSLKHGHGEDSDDPAEQPSAKRARTESPKPERELGEDDGNSAATVS